MRKFVLALILTIIPALCYADYSIIVTQNGHKILETLSKDKPEYTINQHEKIIRIKTSKFIFMGFGEGFSLFIEEK